MVRQRAAAPALTTLLIAALSTGCTQSTEAPGSTGYVLLDRAARGVTTVAQDGWQGAPVLPVALDTGEPLTVRGPSGERSVELKPGMLAHVKGEAGEIEWLEIGESIRDDRLLVHGTGTAASELATWIGGESEARSDGLWDVTADDILDRVSFLNPPAGVLEVMPDQSLVADDLLPSSLVRSSILAQGVIPADAARDAGRPVGSIEAELVGVYTSATRMLWLDAAGGFSMEDRCSGEVLGAGLFFAVDDRVVLQSGERAPVVLGRDRDRLIEPGGAELAPLLPEMPKPKGPGLTDEDGAAAP